MVAKRLTAKQEELTMGDIVAIVRVQQQYRSVGMFIFRYDVVLGVEAEVYAPPMFSYL